MGLRACKCRQNRRFQQAAPTDADTTPATAAFATASSYRLRV
jgi:hypothetical protein